MVGTKIPVIEIENFKIKPSGRGINLYDDATNVDVATWTGKWVSLGSGGGQGSGQFLPAASAAAWLRVTIGGTAYYFPGFNTYW